MGQVISVSQLSDVQPNDWAFEALQSLVERYGCIAGYPDGTFRGKRAKIISSLSQPDLVEKRFSQLSEPLAETELYIFPSGLRNVTLFAGTAAEVSDAFPAIIPFSSEGQGAISRFATLNPVLRVSGGTTQNGLASAVGFIWGISDQIDLRALYGSVNAALPNQGDTNVLGAGFFSGSSVAAAQLTVKPTDTIDIGLNYAHSYHDLNIPNQHLSCLLEVIPSLSSTKSDRVTFVQFLNLFFSAKAALLSGLLSQLHSIADSCSRS